MHRDLREKVRPLCFLAVVLFLVIYLPANAHAVLYKWVDEKGQVHITDYPPDTPAATVVPSEKPGREDSEKKEPVPKPEQPEEKPLALSMEPPAAPQPKAIPPEAKPSVPQQPLPAFPRFPEPKGMPSIPAGELSGIAAALSTFFLVFSIAFYLYFSLCIYLIARKLGVPAPFLAFIPLVQAWTFAVAAKGNDSKPCLWILGLCVPIVGVFIGTYLWMCITENLGREKWLGLLILVPLINIGFMGWLAFSGGTRRITAEEVGPAA